MDVLDWQRVPLYVDLLVILVVFVYEAYLILFGEEY